jgi:hypothetical protein
MKTKVKVFIPGGLIVFVLLTGAIISACDESSYQIEPVVATFDVPDSNITATTAKVKGQIQILGTQQITEFGFELYLENITNTPAVKSFSTTPNLEVFSNVFEGLQPAKDYYVWAYALVNTTKVHQSSPVKFKTKAAK